MSATLFYPYIEQKMFKVARSILGKILKVFLKVSFKYSSIHFLIHMQVPHKCTAQSRTLHTMYLCSFGPGFETFTFHFSLFR